LLCCREASFFDYHIVHGLPPPPFSHPDFLECWCLGNETVLSVSAQGVRRGGSRDSNRWLRMRMCRACVSLRMRANLSTCRVLTSVITLSGSGRWCTFGRTAGRATRPEWIYSQGFYFEPRAGVEVRILWFYDNKLCQTDIGYNFKNLQQNKQTNKQSHDPA